MALKHERLSAHADEPVADSRILLVAKRGARW